MLDLSRIEKYCEKHGYETFLVTILIGYKWEIPHYETHLLKWDYEEGAFIWETDWYEGQHTVELYGFIPIRELIVKGGFPDCILWHN